MKKWKLCNEVVNELLQIYGAVKILLVFTFGLLWRFCHRWHRLSDFWVTFVEILVNMNTFGTQTVGSGSFDYAPET